MISENERAFFERAPIPLVVYQQVDGEVRAEIASDGYCKQVGNPRETVIRHLNTDLYRRVHPDDAEWMRKAGEDFAGDIYLVHSDASEADIGFARAAVAQQFGRDVTQVSTLSPIIGAHTGPGLIALIFYAPGSKR